MIMKEHTHFREDGTEYTHVHHNGDGGGQSHMYIIMIIKEQVMFTVMYIVQKRRGRL